MISKDLKPNCIIGPNWRKCLANRDSLHRTRLSQRRSGTCSSELNSKNQIFLGVIAFADRLYNIIRWTWWQSSADWKALGHKCLTRKVCTVIALAKSAHIMANVSLTQSLYSYVSSRISTGIKNCTYTADISFTLMANRHLLLYKALLCLNWYKSSRKIIAWVDHSHLSQGKPSIHKKSGLDFQVSQSRDFLYICDFRLNMYISNLLH